MAAEMAGLNRDYVFKNQTERRHVTAAWNKNLNPDFREKSKGKLKLCILKLRICAPFFIFINVFVRYLVTSVTNYDLITNLMLSADVLYIRILWCGITPCCRKFQSIEM